MGRYRPDCNVALAEFGDAVPLRPAICHADFARKTVRVSDSTTVN
jgi:hypothetical protein